MCFPWELILLSGIRYPWLSFFFLIQVTFPLKSYWEMMLHHLCIQIQKTNCKIMCLWLFIYCTKQTHIYICAYKCECNNRYMILCVHTYNILMWDSILVILCSSNHKTFLSEAVFLATFSLHTDAVTKLHCNLQVTI